MFLSLMFSLVSYVIIKKSSDLYRSFTFLKKFKSGSFSKSKVSAEASNSNFFKFIIEKRLIKKKKIKINFGFFIIFLYILKKNKI